MNFFKFLNFVLAALLICGEKASAETWNCGMQDENGNYGENVKCTYDTATKTFTISGEGEMGNYAHIDGKPVTPWRDKEIVHAVVEGNVTSIGDRTFQFARKLTDITGLENITRVGDAAFSGASALVSIDLPNVREIGGVAFENTSKLQYIGIPDDVTYLSDTCSRGNTDPHGPCGGAYHNRDTYHGSKVSNCRITGDCGSCGAKVVQSGVGCVNDCSAGYSEYYGYCLRTRYTLPEANAATSDDNENMIEWIFN
ncbi:MAG: leucine-rich repeat protein [Alphaproteobacteria bacterium]|nr:leucine-rich repeat protein [Alphaproteobacteria bacterium]